MLSVLGYYNLHTFINNNKLVFNNIVWATNATVMYQYTIESTQHHVESLYVYLGKSKQLWIANWYDNAVKS